MSKYCPTCRKEYESGKYCVECSSRLIDIVYRNFCPVCHKIADSGKFCVDCGTPLIARRFAGDDILDDDVINTGSSSGRATDAEILAKYTAEEGDLRHLYKDEIPLAIEEISGIAEKGNAEAEVLLSELILAGHLGEPDVDRAYRLLCDAESKGSKQGSVGRALAYIYGLSVEEDLDKAEQILNQVLDVPQALSLKGKIYEERGLVDEATKWYKKAAEKKHWQGLLFMGHAYMNGHGNVEQDPVKAFQYFKEAAALNVPEAKNMLGLCYKNGIGIEPNDELAVSWFREAAADNDTNGLVNLAAAYQRGALGLEQDYEKALELLMKAANNGDAESMYRIGEYYRTNSLLEGQAIEWYQKAADAGYGDAMFRLAQKYLTGQGVEKDPSLAEEWFGQALEAGSLLAEVFQKKLAQKEREEELAREKAEAEERARQEEEAKRLRLEDERKKREELQRIEEQARITAEAKARKIAEEAQRKAEEQVRAAKLEAEQKQNELDAQIAKQKAEQQQRIQVEEKRKKKRRIRWFVFFLLLIGLIGLGWYYYNYMNLPIDSRSYDQGDGIVAEMTSGIVEESTEKDNRDNTPESVVFPSQTRFIGGIKSNKGQTYPIVMVLDYYPSAEAGVLANVSGYYYYQKYGETNNIKLSGTINSASGLSLHTDNGAEEFIGTIDSDYQAINGSWRQIKDGSIVSTMNYSVSSTEQDPDEDEEEGRGSEPDDYFDPIYIESSYAGTLKDLLKDYSPDDVTDLVINGTIDARDFNTLKSTYKNLSYLDLSNTKILAYHGSGGTDANTTEYREDELPLGAFFYWAPIDEGMPSLTEVMLPKSIKAIGRNALARAYNIQVLNIPDGVRSIGYVAFAVCTSLQFINLPSSLTTIEKYAFSSDKNIIRVYCRATVPPMLGNDVFECPKAELHVPQGYKAVYAESAWGHYFSIIKDDL